MMNSDSDRSSQRKAERELTAKERWNLFFKEWVLTLGLALLVAFFFRTTIASPRHIPTGSMIPTIKIGEFIFVKMYAYDWHIPFTRSVLSKRGDPHRGDIVIFEYPVDRSVDYIKRVIGVPGDTVEVREKRVYLNGEALPTVVQTDKSILEDLRGTEYEPENLTLAKETINGVTHYINLINPALTPDFGPVKVPEDSYFVMGDNRDNSQDSRYWGFVPRENIIGQAGFIWLSFDKHHAPFFRFSRFFTMLH